MLQHQTFEDSNSTRLKLSNVLQGRECFLHSAYLRNKKIFTNSGSLSDNYWKEVKQYRGVKLNGGDYRIVVWRRVLGQREERAVKCGGLVTDSLELVQWGRV